MGRLVGVGQAPVWPLVGLPAQAGAPERERLWAPVGEPPRIMTANVKSFPCIGTAQALIFAALDTHKKLGPSIGDIERIEKVPHSLSGRWHRFASI